MIVAVSGHLSLHVDNVMKVGVGVRGTVSTIDGYYVSAGNLAGPVNLSLSDSLDPTVAASLYVGINLS